MKKDSRKEAQLAKEEQQWKRQFAALVKYRRKYGHCLVSDTWPATRGLAKWVEKQRAKYRDGKLHLDRFRKLQQLGFAWNHMDGMWERKFKQLQAFRRRYDHCQVPSRSKKYSSLGNWVHFQRILKRRGRINAKRARRLEQIGFDWVSRGRSLEYRDSAYWESSWNRMLAELAKFKARYDHTWVPAGPPGNPSLCRWVSRQRRLKQLGRLPEHRRRQLEELGFDWRSSSAVGRRWERCFLRLMEFRRRFGHCHVPAEWKENITMGRWAVKTRRQRKLGRLSAEKIRRLNEVGFVWDAIGTREKQYNAMFNERLAELVAFHKKYGHWRVPTDQPRFHSLRIWMDNQRINYSRGWISKERIRQMEKEGFSWLSDRAQRVTSNP